MKMENYLVTHLGEGKFQVLMENGDIERADMALNLKYLRTPYLTKEQIEAEGWSYWKEGPSADGCSFMKDNYSCQMLMDGNVQEENANVKANLEIRQRISHYVLFLGECKDINTFRWLCKLLKIK